MVTIFKNIRETEVPYHREISVILDRIKNGRSKDLVKSIRAEKDGNKRNDIKKLLPAICFSGKFNKRSDKGIVEHSGLICLDFDGYEKTKDLQADKDNISKDKYTYSVFVSPSGKGLKVLIKIPKDIDNHIGYFNALEDYYESPYWDKTSKNISRVCYESYDNLIYVNDDSEIWEDIKEKEHVEVIKSSGYLSVQITDENKIIEILIKWWENRYPMVQGARNQNMYIIAMALNEYGIHKTTAIHILNQYQSEGFSSNEIDTTIHSAYSKTEKFNTKYYEDESRLNEIKVKVRNGSSRNEIIKDVCTDGLSVEAIDSVLCRLKEENIQSQFWSKSEKGAVKIIPILFKNFLEDNGFHKFCPEGGKNYIFVKIVNNLIDNSSEKEIKDFTLDYLLTLDDMSIYNYFAEKVSLFKEDFLTLLSTIDIYFISDTKDSAHLYYKNCAIKVTTKGIEEVDYIDLDGYVWRDHVIDRNFVPNKNINCDYKKFIFNICNKEEGRVETMESTIGYMLHDYKNLSYSPAIILGDEDISDDPEGGTGKGLFMNALSQMKKLVIIDGKIFNFEKSFLYQLVSADTQILCFDDVKKHFDFERLFSIVTEGLTLEKKNKDAIHIPFAKSPKIAITTNYAIEGSGNSHSRRKWEVEMHKAYDMDNTPYDEFHKHFFAEWDVEEWSKFDNYMIGCLIAYMYTGLVKSELVNRDIKKLQEKTSRDFIEWSGVISGEIHFMLKGSLNNGPIRGNQSYENFIEEYYGGKGSGRYVVTRTKFYKWIEAYLFHESGNKPEVGRDSSGKYFIVK